MRRAIATGLAAVVMLWAFLALGAYEDYNKRYGEIRFGKLPAAGAVSKTVWVGSWWSYKKDGIARRFKAWAEEYKPVGEEKLGELSPAEKFDRYVGRADKIDYEKIAAFIEKKKTIETEVDQWIEERRELVYKLNRMIEEHKNDPAWKWQDTEEGKKYQELGTKIEEKQKELEALELQADTAYEWEVMHHGNAQFGVQYWWGHCNAWAAAAVMDAEPRTEALLNGIPFNVGDAKGLLTEAWMECNSSFFGSRCEQDKDETDRKSVDYQDVTPAGFHIFFADQIGIRDKAFVIDQHTGSEVWNQPVSAYRSACEPQYDVDAAGKATPKKVKVKVTYYDGYYGGSPEVRDLGEKDVYPILCTTTIHWMSDGVEPDALTAEYRPASIDDQHFADGWWLKEQFNDHVEFRTLTYVLWLDKPMTDEKAAIIGDGEWNHQAASDYAHLHPDFMWQPTANTSGGTREYENPFVDYKVLSKDILPNMIQAAVNPEVPGKEYASSAAAAAIPDGTEDGKPGAAATMVISVPDALKITQLQVTVDITHTYVGDLQVSLTSPAGKVEVVKPFDEGGSDDDLKRTYDVKGFNGEELQGDWTLSVVDQFAQDTGTLNAWKIGVK